MPRKPRHTGENSEDGVLYAPVPTAVPDDVDPVEFLRSALAISPEDAAKVREDAAEKMKPAEDR